MSRGVNLTEQEWAQIQRNAYAVTAIANHKIQSNDKPRPKMNSWETEYSYELEALMKTGDVKWWGFEKVKLRLADGTYYTPDFFVIRTWEAPNDIWVLQLQFVEIKGFIRDDAVVKFKVAAEMFPFAEFIMLRKRPAKEGGGWQTVKHLNGGA